MWVSREDVGEERLCRRGEVMLGMFVRGCGCRDDGRDIRGTRRRKKRRKRMRRRKEVRKNGLDKYRKEGKRERRKEGNEGKRERKE